MKAKSDKPTVSIIMPVYNAEKYIAEAITSVIRQSFTDWKLIVVDDCSEDRSAEIARRLADTDTRISICINDKNHGAAGSRNKGIALADGEWTAFLDCDDIWRADKLEKQLALAEKTGAGLIYTSYSLFCDEGGNRKSKNYMVPAEVTYRSMLRENYIGCSTVMVKRALLDEHRFSEALHHEDYALWLELLKSGVKAAGYREVLADWRITPDSRSAHKISAAKSRWTILRNVEGLPLHTSLSCFAVYAIRGVIKRYTGFKTVTGA